MMPYRNVFPDFLIVGAQKSGTTALFDQLSLHPQVRAARKKEVQYFDLNRSRSIDWYLQHFPKHFFTQRTAPNTLRRWITGEATPTYLQVKSAPRMIRSCADMYHRKLKIIIILRDPVERAYSHYQMSRQKYEVETLSFSEALEAESDRLSVDSKDTSWSLMHIELNRIMFGYKLISRYVEHVINWIEVFDSNSIKFVDCAAYRKNSLSAWREILDFLHLDFIVPNNFVIRNEQSYDAMPVHDYIYLKDYFYPYNKNLVELIGIDFGW